VWDLRSQNITEPELTIHAGAQVTDIQLMGDRYRNSILVSAGDFAENVMMWDFRFPLNPVSTLSLGGGHITAFRYDGTKLVCAANSGLHIVMYSDSFGSKQEATYTLSKFLARNLKLTSSKLIVGTDELHILDYCETSEDLY